jgi:hypothetical protein
MRILLTEYPTCCIIYRIIMKRLTGNTLAVVAPAVLAVSYLVTASCIGAERENNPAVQCVDGQVQGSGGVKSAVIHAAGRFGLDLGDGVMQQVSTQLDHRLTRPLGENQWVSVGLDETGRPVVAETGTCATTMPGLPTPAPLAS